MYLHLGQDVAVRTSDIVAILDLENASVAKITRAYLAAAEKSGYVINVCTELPKAVVVCQNKKENKVYITQISPRTLKKRASFIDEISFSLT